MPYRKNDARGNRITATANARNARKSQERALAEGDEEAACGFGKVAADFEMDADFWAQAEGE